MIERWFELGRQRATVAGEVRGGLTTFMVMAYIMSGSYCFIKLVRGRGGAVHPMMYAAAFAFVIYFALPALRVWLGV